MTTSSNYSDIEFGMHNNAERYVWASYHLFGFLSSIIGDTLILTASFQKDAFKINKILVTVIQHIAVPDLTYTISALAPTAISLLANSWVLGQTLCYARVYFGYFAFAAGMSLIAVLTSSKLLILKYPLRALSWPTKRAHQVCSLIWAFALIFPILFLAVNKDDVHFDYRVYNFEYGYRSDAWITIIPILRFIWDIVPNIIIVATTSLILAVARKSARRVGGSVPWQGNLTVALTAVVYCISTLPYAVNQIAISCMKDPPELFLVHFYRVSCFLMMINVVANFYIYVLTIRSFRKFLFSKTISVVAQLVSLQNPNTASTATGDNQDRKTADKKKNSPPNQTSLQNSGNIAEVTTKKEKQLTRKKSPPNQTTNNELQNSHPQHIADKNSGGIIPDEKAPSNETSV